ncbi:MAG: asparagine synthase (glutamine-hydrolyzing) [Clostridia bacterium]|nr:asparagine synthase (glutamine-hydrolyzing) [Clostridia bacterium]
MAGWLGERPDLASDPEALRTVERMADRMASRGPDARGLWASGPVAFGHRRLVVVDPLGGGQPMLYRHGPDLYALVYNGELYNTEDLRHELASRGHAFLGHSDTEVLLHAFAEWGEEAFPRLDGIFAVAVWDDTRRRLVVARDRLGVKPLFYWAGRTAAPGGRAFLFASELKGLLAHPAVEPVLDAEGLAEIFALGPGRTPGHGVFRGVREVRPGSFLRVRADAPDEVEEVFYWRLESRPHEDDLETTVETVRTLFLDAARRQLVADVPVSALLSGGLDSSALVAAVTAVFRREGRGPVPTFSVDYAGNEEHFQPSDFQPDDDAPWVERMVAELGTAHRRVVLRHEDLVAALLPAMRARDLPGMADVDASLLLFCRAIKRHATVALSGECADEVFCGYPWFRREDAIAADTFPWSHTLGVRLGMLSPALRDAIRPEAYVARRYEEALAEVPRLLGEAARPARMREIAYLTLTRWMPVLLDRKDRMSMATGLEIRVPFCDHRLVEYVWNVPWEWKFLDGRVKGLFRRAVSGLLPDDVRLRRKSPYPKTFHPGYRAAVSDWLLSILDDPASPLGPLVDRRALREAAQAEGDLEVPFFGQLMRRPQLFAFLVQVDAWLREYRVRLA